MGPVVNAARGLAQTQNAPQARHDLDQVEMHSLVCTASYVSSYTGERRHAVQRFNFKVEHALSVRTKVIFAPETAHMPAWSPQNCKPCAPSMASSHGLRCLQTRAVGESVLLEACLENKTRRVMLLEKVGLLSRPCWQVSDLQQPPNAASAADTRCQCADAGFAEPEILSRGVFPSG